MTLTKELKDNFIKYITGGNSANEQLRELLEYFRVYGAINFENLPSEPGEPIIARSTNFKLGSIVTSGRNPKELDENIRDAILTAFEIPSAYLLEANLVKVGDQQAARYAVA